LLQQEGIEGHVVDPASIATSRRRRTAKTDMIDGKTLLRALLDYKIPWGMDTGQFCGQTEVVIRSLWRRPMSLDHHREEPTLSEPILAPFAFHWNSAVQLC
jgi:transposase